MRGEKGKERGEKKEKERERKKEREKERSTKTALQTYALRQYLGMHDIVKFERKSTEKVERRGNGVSQEGEEKQRRV